jgi:hypothetical protein
VIPKLYGDSLRRGGQQLDLRSRHSSGAFEAAMIAIRTIGMKLVISTEPQRPACPIPRTDPAALLASKPPFTGPRALATSEAFSVSLEENPVALAQPLQAAEHPINVAPQI